MDLISFLAGVGFGVGGVLAVEGGVVLYIIRRLPGDLCKMARRA